MDIKIIVATHKDYWMPNDDVYVPIHVGAALSSKKLDFIGDNTGDNISAKNKNYCELTGLYWFWKNISSDYIGLVHYRRYFVKNNFNLKNKKEKILKRKDYETLLSNNEILLPKQRNYYIETNYSQYIHAHHKEDLDTTRQIITEIYPNYVSSFDKVMNSTKGHRFNMFVMKKDIFNNYCKWLFDILFELERRIDISNYSSYDARVFGFISERLLDVFIDYQGLKYKDIPYVYLEKQNWCKKIFNFIKRKIICRGK
ncbi:MAG: DUF4422 domain-containing protein [Spirochaetales bacterium]|nr:DUF4422 domain-containing protein [Spirochaetales bacterium]